MIFKVVAPPPLKTPDSTNTSLTLLPVMVIGVSTLPRLPLVSIGVLPMKILVVPLKVRPPLNVFTVLLLASTILLPESKTMLCGMTSDVPDKTSDAPLAKLAVVVLLPSALLLPNIKLPALTLTMLLLVRSLLPVKARVPAPPLLMVTPEP